MKKIFINSFTFIFLCVWVQSVHAQVSGWGYNVDGELGVGNYSGVIATPQSNGLTNVTGICGGVYHTLFLNADGTVSSTGGNDNGQLGDGTLLKKNVPAIVSGITNAKQVACGGYHSLVLLQNGTVLSWGWNPYGQLGDGTITQHTTPAAVSGLTNVISIAGGGAFSMALKADGTVWAWGAGGGGQLGNGSTLAKVVPTQVTGLTNVIQISASSKDQGGANGMALKSDGTVWIWGTNIWGNLGIGSTIPGTQTTPIQVPTLSNVTQISAGSHHNVALKKDGTVWSWGYGSDGELGNGTTNQINSTPTQSSTLTDVIQIDASYSHTLVRRRDGSIWGWGYNIVADLGIGGQSSNGCGCVTVPVQTLVGSGNAILSAGNDHAFAAKPQISTPIGSNVVFQGSNVRFTFANVTNAGTTSFTAIDPTATGLNVPSGYTIRANAPAYNITSTATTSGNIDVCLTTRNEYSQTVFNRLTILHGEGGNLVDRTLYKDFANQEICGRVTSFSPFVIAENLTPTAANVSISGRVLNSKGRGLRNAVVYLTDAQGQTKTARTSTFGYYQFNDIEAGQTVVLSIASKIYHYQPQTISLGENLDNVDFLPIE